MNAQEFQTLLAQGEGFTSEFKRSMPSDLGREICALANTSRGVILLGVTDKGEIVGTKSGPSTLQATLQVSYKLGVSFNGPHDPLT